MATALLTLGIVLLMFALWEFSALLGAGITMILGAAALARK